MIALIAGRGQMPVHLARVLGEEGLVTAFEGAEVDPGLGQRVERFRIEALAEFLDSLKARGVDRIVMAGHVRRPALDAAAFDARSAALFAPVMAAMGQGDNALLSAIITLFEGQGFAVVAPHEVDPGLLLPEGVPTRAKPDDRDRADAARGMALLDQLSPADLGQSCVIAGGHPLAVEALPGTDFMLSALEGRGAPGLGLPTGGVFCKAPKIGQDRRVDLPVIGPRTVEGVSRAGLRGLVIEAGGVMVMDPDATLKAADAAGLFLWIRPAER